MDDWLGLAGRRTGNSSAISAELRAELAALTAKRPIRDSQLKRAAQALANSQAEPALQLLSDYLVKHPDDPDGLYLIGQAYMAVHRSADAEASLSRCVDVRPDFDAARFHYAKLLLQRNKPDAAFLQLKPLLEAAPKSALYRDLRAAIYTKLGKYAEWAECYRELTADYPQSPLFWMSFAYALRTLGERDACIAAFRKAIALSPSLGGAYWSLSDLKTFRFDDADIAGMEAQLRRTDLSSENRTYFHFALAKAYQDQAQYGKAFQQYATANALRRVGIDYDPDDFSAYVASCEALFTREFFAARAGLGSASAAPIFVLGMQRAGSTLLEQILSSHSMAEGLGELPEIPLMATQLEHDVGKKRGVPYPQVIGTLDPDDLTRLGEEYIASTARRRTRERAHFVDKHPYNFWSIGLIHLILPNAKIIDIRRHPVACCFSNFTMNFGVGLQHTYRLRDLGQYYRDYARLMTHFDRVLPNKIYRIFYEQLVADPEEEVRKLLAFLGLSFEEACLRFHESERPVMTASSEQVRRPINSEGMERWRHYEPWLGPLRSALGSSLELYPDSAAERSRGSTMLAESGPGHQPAPHLA